MKICNIYPLSQVPSEPDDITHPNTSVGIGFIHVLAPKEQLDALSKQLTVVLGIHPDGSLEDFEVRWTLQSPGHNAGRSTSLKLRLPQTDEEKTWLEKRGAGVYEVAIRVEHEVHAIINQTPHAKLVRLLE